MLVLPSLENGGTFFYNFQLFPYTYLNFHLVSRNPKQISKMGAPTPNFWSKKLLFGKIFFRKLHENERKWTHRGPTSTPLDPPMLKSSNKYALEATGSKNLHPNLCTEVGWKSMWILTFIFQQTSKILGMEEVN